MESEIMILKNILIRPNALNLTIYAAQGDIGSVIALHKLTDVRNLISIANIAIEKASKEKDDITKYCLYRSAILDYNACCDYVLQIIYFGFDFCSRVDSNKSYISQMKDDCRLTIEQKEGDKRLLVDSPFKKKISELKRTNDKAKVFFNTFKEFKSNLRNSKGSISDWANNIKHHGGFVVEELLDKNKLARVQTYNSGEKTFDSSYILTTTTFSEVRDRLFKQNTLIVDFLNYLQDSIFGDTVDIDFGVSRKLFSAEGYNKAGLIGNTYLTSFAEENK